MGKSLPNEITQAIKKIAKQEKVALHEPWFFGNEKNYLEDCIKSNYVSSIGSYVEKFSKELSKFTKSKYVVPVINGTSALHIALKLIDVKPNDEVIIPSPYWVSYPDMVTLAEGTPIIVETSIEDGFKITPDQLEAKITKNTKWFILNSPGNPTGSVYKKNELKEISRILIKNSHLQILSDDIYEHIIYNESFYNILNIAPELYERTFIVNGVSKAFSMTGWRIGYGAGDKAIINSISSIQVLFKFKSISIFNFKYIPI